jgi:hypothetical protein
MKAILALLVLATVGFVVVGCGSAKKAVSGSIRVTGTTTISNVETGSQVICTKLAPPGVAASVTVAVPPPGQSVNEGVTQATITATGSGPSASAAIHLMHMEDGSVTVACKR